MAGPPVAWAPVAWAHPGGGEPHGATRCGPRRERGASWGAAKGGGTLRSFSSAATRSSPESPKLASTAFDDTISSKHWYTCLGVDSDPGPVQRRAKPMPTPTPTLTLTPTHTPAHAPTPAPRSYAEAYQAAGKGARTKPLWCGRAAAAPGVHEKLKVLGAAWLPLGDRLLRWLLALLGGLVTRVQLHRSAWPHARLAFRAGSWKGWGAGVHWLGRRSR